MPAARTERPNVDAALLPAWQTLLLSLADDKLMLGHLNSDWTGLAPTLEEDIAFSALAQDDIAHAQAIFQYLESLTGTRADDLAFGRAPAEYRAASITERADEFDWALAIARQFYVAHFEEIRLGRLAQSNEPLLAGLAKRILAEQQVQIEHVDGWMRRLGRSDDARTRVQTALDALAGDAALLVEPVDGLESLESAGLYPAGSQSTADLWSRALAGIAEPNGFRIALPAVDADARGGRRGVVSDRRIEVLDEMCAVYREDPGARW
ncbi:MAG: 1,2-phenylacetyl-CoA epoxidase subunit PaaC [Phycisphaerales bacterium]